MPISSESLSIGSDLRIGSLRVVTCQAPFGVVLPCTPASAGPVEAGGNVAMADVDPKVACLELWEEVEAGVVGSDFQTANSDVAVQRMTRTGILS